jgi:hypothetical protein
MFVENFIFFGISEVLSLWRECGNCRVEVQFKTNCFKMPIIIKNPNVGQLEEYLMLELQGDLENRYDDVKDCSGCFAGDVLYNKFGHPVSFS